MSLKQLVGGKLILVDRYSQHLYQPMGAPRERIVRIDGVDRREVIQAVNVQFENHFWRGDDPTTCAAIVNFGEHFESNHGFRVEPECLPQVVRSRWPFLHVDNRRRVILALIEGKEPEDALATIDKELEEEVAVARKEQAEATKDVVKCPECGKVAKGRNPRADLVAHMAIAHPGAELP